MARTSIREFSSRYLGKEPPLSLKEDVFRVPAGCEPTEPMSLLDQIEAIRREPSADDFNSRKARILAELARKAYNDEDEIDLSGIPGPIAHIAITSSCDTLELKKFIRREDAFKDVELFVAQNGHGEVVIAFRGTETEDDGRIKDIITDAQALFKKRYSRRKGPASSPNRVHRGFLNAYLRVDDDLAGELEKLIKSTVQKPRLFFTGHSLGGALATVAAMDFAVRQDDGDFPTVPITLYTYGAPRALNRNSQKNVLNHLLSDTYAIANDNDRIPGLPPVIQRTDLRYSHIDHVIVLESNGDFTVRGGDSYRGEVITGPVGGHRVKEYVKRLDILFPLEA